MLVEKPMATSLEEAAELLELAETSAGLLVCAPHIAAQPDLPRRPRAPCATGQVGTSSRPAPATAGPGPWWNEWFYEPGGGSLFDLGVYNVTSLCALFGPAQRVTGDGRRGDPRARR